MNSKLKYPCLVLDHDDTVVQSEATVNYPFFVYILDQFRPGATISLEQYVHGCCHLGFSEMCRRWYSFSEAELVEEYMLWQEYIKDHIPAPFPGVERIIRLQKQAGGLICVVSHSCNANISRDYAAHFGIQPDKIFGWDYPEHQRKPNPYPLERIMEEYQLRPEELLVVDDMKPAWEMATKAGVPIAFAAWGRQDYPEILEEMTGLCDFSFDSPKKLEQFLFEGDELKIEHIALYVNDMEGAKDFFCKYFGAVANSGYHNPTTDFRSYFLRFDDGTRLELMHKPGLKDTPKSPDRMGFIHLAFGTGSKARVDALTRQLQEDGYPVLSGPRTTGDGYYESCVQGFEDNLIEITV